MWALLECSWIRWRQRRRRHSILCYSIHLVRCAIVVLILPLLRRYYDLIKFSNFIFQSNLVLINTFYGIPCAFERVKCFSVTNQSISALQNRHTYIHKNKEKKEVKVEEKCVGGRDTTKYINLTGLIKIGRSKRKKRFSSLSALDAQCFALRVCSLFCSSFFFRSFTLIRIRKKGSQNQKTMQSVPSTQKKTWHSRNGYRPEKKERRFQTKRKPNGRKTFRFTNFLRIVSFLLVFFIAWHPVYLQYTHIVYNPFCNTIHHILFGSLDIFRYEPNNISISQSINQSISFSLYTRYGHLTIREYTKNKIP